MKTLLASAPDKAKLELLINRYFYSVSCSITEDNKIYNSRLGRFLTNYDIEVKKDRWHFYLIQY